MAAQFTRLGTVKLIWREYRFVLGTSLPDRAIKMLSVVNQKSSVFMCVKYWTIIMKFTFFCFCICESFSVTSRNASKCVSELMQ